MSIRDIKREDVIKANQYIHAELVRTGNYNKSPHFLPENQLRVSMIIKKLVALLPNNKENHLLDIGCGTGFIISIAHSHFKEIYGIDITDEMMSEIDLSPGNIALKNAAAEALPFQDRKFDMVTAYSFLDHVLDYEMVLKEVYRVLKNGGIFYADLNPNAGYLQLMEKISVGEYNHLPPLIAREINGALHNGNYYKDKFNIDAELLRLAEPIKSYSKGFDQQTIEDLAKEIGFSKVTVEHEWFLGQATIAQENGKLAEDTVANYLNMVLPASTGLFKYLRFIFVR
jgi:ubiquinone/menaquinone biosynthesis C-methylase UbiE